MTTPPTQNAIRAKKDAVRIRLFASAVALAAGVAALVVVVLLVRSVLG